MDSLPNENDSAEVLASKYAAQDLDGENMEVPIHAGHRFDPAASAAMKVRGERRRHETLKS